MKTDEGTPNGIMAIIEFSQEGEIRHVWPLVCSDTDEQVVTKALRRLAKGAVSDE